MLRTTAIGRLLGRGLLLALLALGAGSGPSGAETCVATSSGTWGPLAAGSASWSCPGGPAPGDGIYVPSGVELDVVGDLVQDGTPGAGIVVAGGAALRAQVTEATGPLTLVLGPAGLTCELGALCSFRGGYREFGSPTPQIQTTLSASNVLRVGEVLPCDGDDGAGAFPDCDGMAAQPGDPSTVRFDYAGGVPGGGPTQEFLEEALQALDPARDMLCFFPPDPHTIPAEMLPAEVNQCFDLADAGGGSAPYVRIDVTQSVREQPGYPRARKQVRATTLTADVAPGDREIRVSADTVDADDRYVARWLVFEGVSGRPQPRAYRILRTDDGGSGDDTLVLGDLRGAAQAHGSGESAWISYGFVPNDPFLVIAPVHITSATADPDDTLLQVGDGDVTMEAVWLDDLRRVDARGNGVHSYTRLWFRDPTPAQAGGPIDRHAFHVDHRDATEGRFVFRQVNVTGGDDRPAVCGTSGSDPCVHDAIHWGKSWYLLLEDVATRYVGEDCFPAHGGNKRSFFTTLRRLSCEFSVDNASQGKLLDFESGLSVGVTVEDVFCGDCGTDGDWILVGVGSGGSAQLDGLTIWGSRSLRFLVTDANEVRNLFVAGGRTTSTIRLPDRLEGFVHREAAFVGTGVGSADLWHAGTVLARHGVVDALAVSSRILARPGPAAELENVALVDVRSSSAQGERTLFAWQVPPAGTVLRRVLAWFPPASAPRWNHVLQAAGDPVSLTLDGLFVAHARGDVETALDLSSSQVAATTFGAGPCFLDNTASVRPGTESQYPVGTVWDAGPSFANEGQGNLLPLAGSPAASAGCGLDAGRPPGLLGRRFAHALTKTNPELIGPDGDADGIPEIAAAPCAGGALEGCSDNCPGVPNPSQLDPDGDGVGIACQLACADSLDNDGDGLVDLADPGCLDASDESEETLGGCGDGLDNDGDGLVDAAEDPGCDGALDDLETSLALPCDDGHDNDGDGWVDAAEDPGCAGATSFREDPRCDDRADNDGDGWVDLADPQCTQPWGNRESPRRCGLGFELSVLLFGLRRLSRGSARQSGLLRLGRPRG